MKIYKSIEKILFNTPIYQIKLTITDPLFKKNQVKMIQILSKMNLKEKEDKLIMV